jgi:1-acyl-sn-glycerol-3-phosphate acyltransferase
LLYSLLKIPAKFALRIYCRQVLINRQEILQSKGPLLIASNHPNSFLDAIILATLFNQPIFSLARGDAFANNFYSRLLRSLNMFPVYRISEGVENLENNYSTFDSCQELFKKNGIVLIFSEGRCINEWRLRPLKKGTARLAFNAWQNGTALKVLPAGINYSSFTVFGKNIHLNFGDVITQKDFDLSDSFGNNINSFNGILQNQLEQLVVQVDKKDTVVIKEKFEVKQPQLKKIILFIPAMLGWITSAPLYYPIKKFTSIKAAQNDHYDSVMVGLLFILYPLYLLIIGLLIYWFTGGWYWLLVFIVLPFSAWSYVQLKKQF